MPQSKIRRKPGIVPAAFRTTMEWDGRKRIVKHWVRMFRSNWEEIALDEGLNRSQLRILILCSVNLGPKNQVQLNQSDMAFGLHLSQSCISRCIKLLVANGLILRQGSHLFLNSRLATAQGMTIPEIAERRREEIPLLRHIDPAFHDKAFPKE